MARQGFYGVLLNQLCARQATENILREGRGRQLAGFPYYSWSGIFQRRVGVLKFKSSRQLFRVARSTHRAFDEFRCHFLFSLQEVLSSLMIPG